MSANDTRTGAHGDIAVIGMSCIFPRAPDLDTYWANICGKVDAIGEPIDSWEADRYYDPDDDSGEKIYTKAGGFLRDLYTFDAPSFGIMPNSVDGGEPDQFLALRVARDALADAGYLGEYDHTNTGVILGHSTYLHRGMVSTVQHGVVLDQTIELIRALFPHAGDDDLTVVRDLMQSKLPPFNADIAPGLVPNVMTGRICNRLDLKGPNYIIDAACSSSLLSVKAAMEELRRGNSDLMLAGGVNASMPAEVLMVFTHLGALSRTSRIRPFDQGANGTLLGEGLGVVVLKRLDDALADGDRVYAVIKEVGQSSDGKGMGLLAPSMEGEMLAIRRAYGQSGVDPATIGLVEAHGTGIPLGDKTEIEALRAVFGTRDGGLPRCALGSVKSMISHCIPAAGIAGLIKTVLALHHKVLPPTLCDEVNPALGIEDTPLYVNNETRPWIHPTGRLRRAAVNAFGFGGINTHAVLEEIPVTGAADDAVLNDWPHELVVLAAGTRSELIGRMDALAGWIERAERSSYRLRDVASTLAGSVTEGTQRLAIACSDLADLREKLLKTAKQLTDPNRHALQTRTGIFFTDKPIEGRLAFLFPGEGAQYPGMLADLARLFPVVRRWFDFWESLHESSGFSPSSVIYPPPTCVDEATMSDLLERLHGVEMGSESVFIACQAIHALLGELGVSAEAMVGHSSGENSALVASGLVALDGEDDLRRHIQLLKTMYGAMEQGGAIATGAMLTVGAVDRRKVLELVETHGGQLHMALDNCDHQSVLFGPREALEKAADELRSQGGLCSFLSIDRAYHTPLFDSVAEGLAKAYEDIGFDGAGAIEVYSCATAEPFPSDPDAKRRLAISQWSARVRFKETIDRMYEDGFRFFLEVGPASNLSNFASDILRGRECVIASTDNRRRDTLAQLLPSLARLFVNGRTPNLAPLWAGRQSRTIDFSAEIEPPPRRQMPVRNTLPYIRLTRDEQSQVAARLLSGRGAAAPPAAAAVEPESPMPAAAHPPTASTPPPAGPAPALAEGDNILDTPTTWPFVNTVVHRDDAGVQAECHLDSATQRYLRHHVLYASQVSALDPQLHALSVVPLAVSLEMLAEVAAILCTQPYLNCLENVRAHNWITLDQGPRVVRMTARRVDDPNDERIHAMLLDGDTPLIECDVVFGQQPLTDEPGVSPLGPAYEPVTAGNRLYDTGMFHGPLFRSVGHLVGWNEQGADAVLNDTPVAGFMDGDDEPAFLLNPVLLDAVGQLTAFWLHQDLGGGFSTFPSTIDRIELVYPEQQATAGCVLRGRIGFDAASGGRMLTGNFDCIAPDGYSLFRVSGWSDVYLDVPETFYHARTNPRDCWYGQDWGPGFDNLPNDTTLWFLPAFSPAFLEGIGGVSKRLLAQTILSAEERQTWREFGADVRRGTQWLLGRLAIKEAARLWIWRRTGQLLFPADVTVRSTDLGMPYVADTGVAGLGPPPRVSLAHVRGSNIAVACDPDAHIGVDLEIVGRVDTAELMRGGFAPEERHAVEALAAEHQQEWALRYWCAKEAAAKSLGTGFDGRASAFRVTHLSADGQTGVVSVDGAEIPVGIRRRDDAIVALAGDGLTDAAQRTARVRND